jgi:hypothetical protein
MIHRSTALLAITIQHAETPVLVLAQHGYFLAKYGELPHAFERLPSFVLVACLKSPVTDAVGEGNLGLVLFQ